jgi:hypothetical protein
MLSRTSINSAKKVSVFVNSSHLVQGTILEVGQLLTRISLALLTLIFHVGYLTCNHRSSSSRQNYQPKQNVMQFLERAYGRHQLIQAATSVHIDILRRPHGLMLGRT